MFIRLDTNWRTQPGFGRLQYSQTQELLILEGLEDLGFLWDIFDSGFDSDTHVDTAAPLLPLKEKKNGLNTHYVIGRTETILDGNFTCSLFWDLRKSITHAKWVPESN
ncbi:unnamed protein product [Nippostrongylus brasiliensis]|uniref:HET domain-containing protein n=1 Tax=Nippostrongylus brasiliensis TaxID=27835 RepID=A0A0N4YFH8_NIPBR|nr:unnamed protein product [Nippostrongylus brasiliensis]